MKFPIALQLYSVREDMEADFEGTLRKVKALGYDGVEFAGLFGHAPTDIAAMLADIGLVPVSAHVPYEELSADPAGKVAEYKAVGVKYVVIPYLTEPYRPGAGKFSEVIDNARIIGQAARDAGITLLYHNHDFEFEKIDGNYALDVLYASVPADLLQTELDTCWVNVGGEVPADYILKYAGRTPVVHLKDFVMPGKKPAKLYELIGIEEKADEEAEAFDFRPVGSGVQDFPAILAACEKAGAKWVVVEQDRPSLGKTPMACAEMSIQYLRSL